MQWKYFFNHKGVFDTPVPSAKLLKILWVPWEWSGIGRNREPTPSWYGSFCLGDFELDFGFSSKNPGLAPRRRLQSCFDLGPPRSQRQGRYLTWDDGLGNEEFMSNKRNDEILNQDYGWGKSTPSASPTLWATRAVRSKNHRKWWKCPLSAPEMLWSAAQQSPKHQNTATLPWHPDDFCRACFDAQAAALTSFLWSSPPILPHLQQRHGKLVLEYFIITSGSSAPSEIKHAHGFI